MNYKKINFPPAKIREVTLADLTQLQQIAKQTFVEAYAWGNTEENMRFYLDAGFSVGKLKRDIQDHYSRIFFAQINKKVVGYMKLNFGEAQTEKMPADYMEIERLYVLKQFHERKIGSHLISKAIEVAKAARVRSVWLGVWEKNPGAIVFYQKLGFGSFDKHTFRLGDEDQTDIMMRMDLSAQEA